MLLEGGGGQYPDRVEVGEVAGVHVGAAPGGGNLSCVGSSTGCCGPRADRAAGGSDPKPLGLPTPEEEQLIITTLPPTASSRDPLRIRRSTPAGV